MTTREARNQRSIVITPPSGFPRVDFTELWEYRDLLGILAMRDIRARYKQTILGVTWALLQPLAVIGIFTLLFGLLMGQNNLPTAPGIPYALSTLCALLPWNLFAVTVAQSGSSLVDNRALVTKVYFPRLLVPAAPAVAALVDFAIVSALIVVMIAFYHMTGGHRFEPSWALATLPLFTALALASAFGAALWLSAATAIYRDVRYVTPFLTQLLLYLTPVVYSAESIVPKLPPWARFLYELNPMVGVVEGFRWALFGLGDPPGRMILLSALVVGLLILSGLHYFRRMERHFADLV